MTAIVLTLFIALGILLFLVGLVTAVGAFVALFLNPTHGLALSDRDDLDISSSEVLHGNSALDNC